MTLPTVGLRPAQPSDEGFLLELRRLTMTAHLERAGEPTDDESHLQRMRYRFEDATIMCLGDTPVGLLKVRKEPDQWTLIQIQILPTYQGKGLGSQVIEALLAQAGERGLPVRLRVLAGNPARRLYELLGFRPIAETDRETTLVWQPK